MSCNLMLGNYFRLKNRVAMKIADNGVELVKKVNMNSGLQRVTKVEIAGSAGVPKLVVQKGNMEYTRYLNGDRYRVPLDKNGNPIGQYREIYCSGLAGEKPTWINLVNYYKQIG